MISVCLYYVYLEVPYFIRKKSLSQGKVKAADLKRMNWFTIFLLLLFFGIHVNKIISISNICYLIYFIFLMKIKRLVAFYIDLISILFPGAIISLFMDEHPLTIIIVFSLIFSLILNKDILDGQSLGKRILKLKVVKKKGQSTPSRLICCIRNIFLFLWPIDLFLILFTGKKLGDYITQTEVVTKTNATEAVTRNVITRSILFIIITAVIISLILYFTVYNSRSYRLLYI